MIGLVNVAFALQKRWFPELAEEDVPRVCGPVCN